jgi:hypothetical protein
MAHHLVSDHLPSFDRHSYLLGITAAFVEVVAMGCKRLALSSPYTDVELAVLLAPTQQLVEEAGLTLLVEPNLLMTPLFPADAAADRIVILIARDQVTIAAYQALVAERTSAAAAHRLAEVEMDLAWQFGRLLSYDDAAIQELIARHHR